MNSSTPRKSSKSRQKPAQKPAKPSADFPLFPHRNGQWAKKVRGKLVYFGPWSDPQAALEKWHRQRDDLLAGRVPREDSGDGLTMADLANCFLTAKDRAVAAGELSNRGFNDYYQSCQYLVKRFGGNRLVDDIRPDDFGRLRADLFEQLGSPVTVRTRIARIRTIFRFASDNELIDRPVKFGSEFRRPLQQTIDRHKLESPAKMFTRKEVQQILNAASPWQKAAVLLGLNCGLGNTDLATLRQSAIDWEGGWLNHPRPKTAVSRRIPLWKETLDALRVALDSRPEPQDKQDADLVFLTRFGQPVVREEPIRLEDGTRKLRVRDTVCDMFLRLFRRLGINRGRSFYSFRHMCETLGGGARDQVAVDAVMGHRTPGMGTQYREAIEDERLRAVTDQIHDWLFPPADPTPGEDSRSDEGETGADRPRLRIFSEKSGNSKTA